MSVFSDLLYVFSKSLAARGFIIRSGRASNMRSDPTVTSGEGVPTGIQPKSSTYHRMDAPDLDHALYVSDGATWAAVPTVEGGALAAAAAAQDTADAASAALNRIHAPVANAAAVKAIAAVSRTDGMVVLADDTKYLWVFDADDASGADDTHLVPDAGTGRWIPAADWFSYNGYVKADTALNSTYRLAEQIVPMSVPGPWAFDGDGARTNGGGLVGATPTLTEAAPGQCQVENGGVFGNLAAVNAGYSAIYQMFPDVPVAEADFVYFGASIKFAEIAIDIATVATYDAAGVLTWQYWDGATWSTLTIAHDGTSASTDGGALAFGRDGAICFVPPSDWAQSTINGGTLFWIRAGIAAGKAANMTAIPITNGKQHEIVTPNGGFLVRQAFTITTLRICDSATTLHTGADVKFVLMNVTTGANTGTLTFAQDVRTQRFTGLSLACAINDVLGGVLRSGGRHQRAEQCHTRAWGNGGIGC